MPSYQGTKLQDIATVPSGTSLDNSYVLIITSNNQYLVPMSDFIAYIKSK